MYKLFVIKKKWIYKIFVFVVIIYVLIILRNELEKFIFKDLYLVFYMENLNIIVNRLKKNLIVVFWLWFMIRLLYLNKSNF